jgi:hypothetical protein
MLQNVNFGALGMPLDLGWGCTLGSSARSRPRTPRQARHFPGKTAKKLVIGFDACLQPVDVILRGWPLGP